MNETTEKITISSLKIRIEKLEKEHYRTIHRFDDLLERSMGVSDEFPEGFLDVFAMTISEARQRKRLRA